MCFGFKAIYWLFLRARIIYHLLAKSLRVKRMKNIKSFLFVLSFILILSPGIHAKEIVKVAILPFQINSPEDLNYLKNGILDILSSRIAVEGRVIVLENDVINQAITQSPRDPLTERGVKSIGNQLGVDFIIYGSLTKIGDSLSVDARLFDLKEDKFVTPFFATFKGMDNIIPEMVQFASRVNARIMEREHPQPTSPPLTAIAPPSDPTSAFITAKGEREFWKSQSLPVEIKGVDIGDVDGDGKNETVVIGTRSLDIYTYSDDRLLLKKGLQGRRADNYLSLDVADINGNGVAEIFVSNVVNDSLESFVIEFQGGEFTRIVTDEGYFFRVIHTTKEGKILIGQKMGLDGILYGSVYKLVWKDNRLMESRKIPLSKKSIVCGFNLIDVDKEGEEEIVLIDNNDSLKVFSSNGKLLWRSVDIYGGTKDFLVLYPLGLEERGEGLEERIYLQKRVLFRNQKKGSEVIIVKNISATGKLFARVRSYKESEVYSLVWDGLGLSENWRTKKIHGYTADFQIKDIDNDGRDELVVGIIDTSTGSIFGKKKSFILAYEL